MLCSKCGSQNSEGAQFCKDCGTPLNSGVSSQENVQNNNQQNVSSQENVQNNNQQNVSSQENVQNNNQQNVSNQENVQNNNQQNVSNQENVQFNNPVQNQQNNGQVNGFQGNSGMNNQNKPIIPIIIAGGGVLLVIVVVMILTVFKSETVTCTNTMTKYGLSFDETAAVNFKGNKVKDATITIDYKVPSYYTKYIDTFYSQLEKSFDQYKQKEGVDVEIQKGTDKITIIIKANRKGIEELGEVKISGTDESPEKFIKDMKTEGFTCTKK